MARSEPGPLDDLKNDDFVRPGEPGFEGFPKQLPDDSVHYTIHVVNGDLPKSTKLSSRLKEIQKAASTLQKSVLKDYIWQRDGFELSIRGSGEDVSLSSRRVERRGNGIPKITSQNQTESSLPTWYLEGTTSYGDSIADEWLIVYLLRELSKQFFDAWIRVWDADGQFLLIEAAHSLPKWLEPEAAPYRVWIHQGGLWIIPMIEKGSDYKSSRSSHNADNSSSSDLKDSPPSQNLPKQLTLSTALSYLQNHGSSMSNFIVSPEIENEAFHRIKKHPEEINNNFHVSVVTIPRLLAFLLRRCPQHVSPAIEAFYLRDPVSMKPLLDDSGQRKIAQGENILTGHVFSPHDCVDVHVKLPRVGFAQLRGQVFEAPNKSWGRFLLASGTVNPSTVSAQKNRASASAGVNKEQLRRETGMKLTCGFEMLLADETNQDKRSVREMNMLLEDIREGDDHLPSDAEVSEWNSRLEEDNEAWLDVDFEEFEKELSGKSGSKNEKPANSEEQQGFGDKNAQENLRRMVERFENFINDEDAGIEGAEFENSDSDGDSDVASKNGERMHEQRDFGSVPENTYDKKVDTRKPDKDSKSDTSDDSNVPFDEDEFSRILQQTMNMTDEEKRKRILELDEDSDDMFEEHDKDEEDSEEEGEAVRKLMESMESELRTNGALNTSLEADRETDSSLDKQDPRYAFAKYLLESFKRQAGDSGPSGNLMNAFGLQMPRDEDEEQN